MLTFYVFSGLLTCSVVGAGAICCGDVPATSIKS